MKYKYPALIIKDDDGFFVEFPDLNHTEILVNDRPIALIPDTDMIDIVLQAEQFAMFEVGTLKRLFVKGYILDGIEQLSRTKSAFFATPIEEKVDKNGRKYRTRLSKKNMRRKFAKRTDSIKVAINKNFDDLDDIIEW